MKMIVISDNQYYLEAFNDFINCNSVLPENVALTRRRSFSDAIVIINISNGKDMLSVLDKVMKSNVLSVFIQGFHSMQKNNIYCFAGVYIIPYYVSINQFIHAIYDCMYSSEKEFQVSLSKIRTIEWDTATFLITGISNRKLSTLTTYSEKRISRVIRTLSDKLGLSEMNRAYQLSVINTIYLIYVRRQNIKNKCYQQNKLSH
ncbi:Uncharacterised protein [Klebsiella pneumoniae]|nr:Uncharacterised protein [Klebsiella pneumoniae]